MTPAVASLQALGHPLTDDLPQKQVQAAKALLADLPDRTGAEVIKAPEALLPANGDTCFGLNWTLLHTAEAAPVRPIWSLVDDPEHERAAILRQRLINGGCHPPDA